MSWVRHDIPWGAACQQNSKKNMFSVKVILVLKRWWCFFKFLADDWPRRTFSVGWGSYIPNKISVAEDQADEVARSQGEGVLKPGRPGTGKDGKTTGTDRQGHVGLDDCIEIVTHTPSGCPVSKRCRRELPTESATCGWSTWRCGESRGLFQA
jgi:hypothetical protein